MRDSLCGSCFRSCPRGSSRGAVGTHSRERGLTPPSHVYLEGAEVPTVVSIMHSPSKFQKCATLPKSSPLEELLSPGVSCTWVGLPLKATLLLCHLPTPQVSSAQDSLPLLRVPIKTTVFKDPGFWSLSSNLCMFLSDWASLSLG